MEDTGPETPEPARKRSKKAKPGAAAATPGGLAALHDFISACHYFAGLMVCMSYHILFAGVHQVVLLLAGTGLTLIPYLQAVLTLRRSWECLQTGQSQMRSCWQRLPRTIPTQGSLRGAGGAGAGPSKLLLVQSMRPCVHNYLALSG